MHPAAESPDRRLEPKLSPAPDMRSPPPTHPAGSEEPPGQARHTALASPLRVSPSGSSMGSLLLNWAARPDPACTTAPRVASCSPCQPRLTGRSRDRHRLGGDAPRSQVEACPSCVLRRGIAAVTTRASSQPGVTCDRLPPSRGSADRRPAYGSPHRRPGSLHRCLSTGTPAAEATALSHATFAVPSSELPGR